MKTVKELILNDIASNTVDVITVIEKGCRNAQYDNVESLIHEVGDNIVIDYEIEYDADEGMVYLDIYIE